MTINKIIDELTDELLGIYNNDNDGPRLIIEALTSKMPRLTESLMEHPEVISDLEAAEEVVNETRRLLDEANTCLNNIKNLVELHQTEE